MQKYLVLFIEYTKWQCVLQNMNKIVHCAICVFANKNNSRIQKYVDSFFSKVSNKKLEKYMKASNVSTNPFGK